MCKEASGLLVLSVYEYRRICIGVYIESELHEYVCMHAGIPMYVRMHVCVHICVHV